MKPSPHCPRSPSIIAALFLSVSLHGCTWVTSFFEETPPVEERQEATKRELGPGAENGASSPSPRSKQGTEIVWIVPGEPVDGFVIRYGPTPDSMTQEVRVQTSELRASTDPVYGQVFRYVIQGVETLPVVNVSIASYKGDQISEFSAVMEEQAASRTP